MKKSEKEKEGIAALDLYLQKKRNPGTIVKPKAAAQTEKEAKGMAALDKYLKESKPLNQ